MVPPTKTQEDGRPWVVGPPPVLKTFGQRAVLPGTADSGTGDCPLGPGVGTGVMGVSGSDAPAFRSVRVHNRRAHSELLLRLVHRFCRILGGILAGFIVLEQLFQSLHLGHPLQAELLEIPSQGVHQAALVAIELA